LRKKLKRTSNKEVNTEIQQQKKKFNNNSELKDYVYRAIYTKILPKLLKKKAWIFQPDSRSRSIAETAVQVSKQVRKNADLTQDQLSEQKILQKLLKEKAWIFQPDSRSRSIAETAVQVSNSTQVIDQPREQLMNLFIDKFKTKSWFPWILSRAKRQILLDFLKFKKEIARAR